MNKIDVDRSKIVDYDAALDAAFEIIADQDREIEELRNRHWFRDVFLPVMVGAIIGLPTAMMIFILFVYWK